MTEEEFSAPFSMGIYMHQDGTYSPMILFPPCANEQEAEEKIHTLARHFERIMGEKCLSRIQ